MSLTRIEQAKRETIAARARLDGTLRALQQRLRPASLAGEAWDGVKDKSADLADDALEAVKSRPGTVSAVIGAFALFLAREPIKRGMKRLISGDDEDRAEGRIESAAGKLNKPARTARSRVKEGVS